MNSQEAIEAKLSGAWRQVSGAPTGFRLHFDPFSENHANLALQIEFLGVCMGMENLHERITGAGPSSKISGAGVVAFCLSSWEQQMLENCFDDLEWILHANGVRFVEAGDAIFVPLMNAKPKPENDFVKAFAPVR